MEQWTHECFTDCIQMVTDLGKAGLFDEVMNEIENRFDCMPPMFKTHGAVEIVVRNMAATCKVLLMKQESFNPAVLQVAPLGHV